MKLIIAIIIAIACTHNISAQSHQKLVGTVKDSLQQPIIGASVSLIDKESGAGSYFTSTTENGHFEIVIDTIGTIDPKDYTIKISSIGYKTAFIPMHNPRLPININLKHDTQYLEPVVVKNGNDYVTKNKDTLTYNVEKFSEKNDRVLKDLLSHLPGVEVAIDGSIKYNGTAINKLYIEGQDMLSERYNLATNNIGANTIDKIQVIEHNQDVKLLKGFVTSDQPGINIKLKDKNKFKTNFKADLGAGIPAKYNVDISALTFKQKYLGLNILKLNNIGNTYTSEVRSNSVYDFANLAENSQPPGLLSIGLPNLSLNRNRYLNNRSGLISLNDFFVLKNQTTFRVNGWVLNDLNKQNYIENNEYLLPQNNNITYYENIDHTSSIKGFSIQLNLTKNTSHNYFTNTFTIENNRNNQAHKIISNQGLYDQTLSNPNFKITNTYNKIWVIKNKNRLQYFNYISYYVNPQQLSISSSDNINLFVDSVHYNQIIQKSKLPSYYFDNALKYFIDKNKIKFTVELGAAYQQEKLLTDLTLIKNNDVLIIPQGFTNNINWHKAKVYNNTSLIYEKGRARLDLNVMYNFTHLKYEDFTVSGHQKIFNKILWHPTIFYRNKIGRESELIASYGYENKIGSINNVYPNPIIFNYRTISASDIPIYLGSNMFMTASYKFKRTLKLLFGNINFTTSKSYNNYIISQIIDALKSTNTAIPQKNTSQSYTLTTGISKYLFSLRTNISATIAGTTNYRPLYQNESLFTANIKNITGNLDISPKIFDWIKLDFHGTYSRTSYSSKNKNFLLTKTISFTERSSITLYPRPSTSIQLSNEYYNYSTNKVINGDCLFVDAFIQQTLKNKIDCRLSMQNIANKKMFTSTLLSNNLIQNGIYSIQPRTYMVSLYFNL